MKRPLFRTLGFALALAICAVPLSVPDAFAQTITLEKEVPHDVYGNSDNIDPSSNGYGAMPSPVPNSATDSHVIVNDGGKMSNVYGAWTESADGSATATGNSVTVNDGGTVDGAVYGAWAQSTSADGSATASGNSITVNDGGTVGGFVYSGYAYSANGSATASGNSVTVNDGGSTQSVHSGYATSTNGSATASGNSVTINGGTVTGDVYGGNAGSDNGSATANGNSVTINGGTVTGDVYGGYADSSGGSATANNNIVTISGNTTLGAGLYGGYSNIAGASILTGNTLNLHSQISVGTLAGFEFLNFYLPSTLTVGDPAMLTITGNMLPTDLRNSTVNVGIDGGSSPLAVNDEITLIDASAGPALFGPQNSTANGQGMQGVTLKYEFDIVADTAAKLLTARVTSVGANEQTKALSEGAMGGLSLATAGADVVAGSGMANAMSATRGASGGGGAGGAPMLAGFSAVSAGSMRMNTGSHVDMNSLSLMTGLAWGVDTTPGRLTLGAFFEYGNGSYDSHNSFSNSASVNGDGDTYYYGGGVLGRMDFANTGPGRFYTEASARMGKAHNEYSSSDLQYNGIDAEYDSSSLYYGFHLGTGYIWNITEAASLDLYGKYFWTRQEGDSVTLSTNDPVTFKDADSSRLRFGGRFAYAVNEYVSPYVGAAYEHEYDGTARATTNGFGIDAPSLKGDTGIGEIGLTLKPATTLPLSFDLGLQGYTGKREGVTGSVQAKLEF